ncbi:MAG: tetratricopeptide repeat-containing sensor histidine kinase [Bacteroidia bacterium]
MIQVNLALAQLYQLSDEPEQTIHYSITALQLATAARMDSIRALIMFFIGEGYLEREQYAEGLSYLREALNDISHVQNVNYKIGILNRTAEAYTYLGEDSKALPLHESALALARNNKDNYGMADSYYGLANVYSGRNQYDHAITFLDSSTSICQRTGFDTQLLKNYRKYISIYLRTDQYAKFMRYQNQSEILRAKIDKDQKSKVLARVRQFYETENMEWELAVQEAKLKLSAAELKNTRTQVQFAIVMGIFLAFLVAIFFFQYQQKKKINEELEVKVADRTRELRTAYGEVVQLNEELDTFAYRTAHDIRGPVARLLGLCQLVISTADKQEADNYTDMIHREAISMDFMLHRFLEVNKIKHIHPVIQRMSLEPLLRSVWLSLEEIEGFGEITFSIAPELPESLETDARLAEIVLRNIFENAIVFRTKEKSIFPAIRVEGKIQEDGLHLRILDNGIGIRPDVASRIFEMFFRGTTASTGLGLGLYATRLAIEKLEGSVTYHPDNLAMTEFEIIFPPAPSISEKT